MPELTSEKFCDSIFSEGKMYKTEDVGKWCDNGEIEYVGRKDYQVKIRGYRIELEEIENLLNGIDSIKEVVVIDKEDKNSNKYLCAYYVSNSQIEPSVIKAYLSKKLPNHMIPSSYVQLEKMPITPSGKIDRKGLQNTEHNSQARIKYEEPRDDIETILAELWAESLDIQKVGIDDNFFELGGDSLRVITLFTKTIKYNWDISIQDFYKYQTIRRMAEEIRDVKRSSDESIREHTLEIVKRESMGNVTSISKGIIQFKNILLTGATGFLGVHLLDEILTSTQASIYCLIREENKYYAEKKLLKILQFYFGHKWDDHINKRIYVVNGDIALSKFGLYAKEYNVLGENIDLIIHTAALVKHYGHYDEFYNINVLGTERVIDFAKTFKIRMNHISTISVAGEYVVSDKKKKVKFDEDSFYVGQNYLDSVYGRSKFEAENIVYKAMNDGLEAVILRVGNLSSRYIDGQFQRNINENAFFSTMKSIINLGVIPEGILNRELEFSPVDYCSRAILRIAERKESNGRVFHVVNNKTIKVNKILGMLKDLDITIDIVSNDSFVDRFYQSLLEINSNEIQYDLINNNIIKAYEYGYMNSIIIDSNTTNDYLKKLDFEYPEIEDNYLNNTINYMRSVKFLPSDSSIRDYKNA